MKSKQKVTVQMPTGIQKHKNLKNVHSFKALTPYSN